MQDRPASRFVLPRLLAFAAVVGTLLTNSFGADAKKPTSREAIETATRLQVFLDRANFAPGKLDGQFGDFTRKALALYRESRGEQPPATTSPAKSSDAPDLNGLDLASIDPVFISYTVTEADLQNVGELPDNVAEKAKLKALSYASAAEAVAEKFHCDIDFLEQLNPGKTKALKAGDEVKVPNVEPFELAAVKDLKPGSELNPDAANAIEDEDTITLRRVSHPANRGLVDLLLACPSPFEVPARERDDSLTPGF